MIEKIEVINSSRNASRHLWYQLNANKRESDLWMYYTIEAGVNWGTNMTLKKDRKQKPFHSKIHVDAHQFHKMTWTITLVFQANGASCNNFPPTNQRRKKGSLMHSVCWWIIKDNSHYCSLCCGLLIGLIILFFIVVGYVC